MKKKFNVFLGDILKVTFSFQYEDEPEKLSSWPVFLYIVFTLSTSVTETNLIAV